MARAGVRRFWASSDASLPRVRVVELAPVVALLVVCAALTVQAAAPMRYLGEAAQALRTPVGYIDRVMNGR
jgi:multicomponent K+:H+ antiporter subunit D